MKSLLLICILFCSVKSFSQNAYYDAIRLSKYLENNSLRTDSASKAEYSKILNNYLIKPHNKFTARTIFNDYTVPASPNFNPFLNQFFPVEGSGAAVGPTLTKQAANLSSSVGSLNITSIADGLSRFLIKRGKEELNVAFFNQFKQFLNDNKNEECRILFPNTVDLLEKIDSYKYATFLENLRSGFKSDLGNLIIHLNQVIDLPKYESLKVNQKEIKLVIGTANIVSELSQSGKNIMADSVIKQLAVLPWGSLSKNLENSLKFLNLISASIRASSSPIGKGSSLPNTWVSLSDLNTNLFTDTITLRIFFGLLYQQANSQNIAFYKKDEKDSTRLDALMKAQKNHIFRLTSLIQNFSLLADDLENSIENIKTKKIKGLLNDEDYYTYINKAINLIDYGLKLPTTLNIAKKLKNDIYQDKHIALAKNANYLYKNIYTKNYSSAVLNVCSILDSLLPDNPSKNLISGILKYGNFMASVVDAQSPEDFQSAIEAAALPAGSSSIKKNSSFNISLNAYIGGYFASSINNKIDIDGNNSKVGITAPIGIAFSWGLGHFKNGTSIGSLSAYGTLIDVGAVAGFRLSNDSTALEQKITIGDIFAPGGYVVYGIGSPFKFLSYVPISVAYGWQYGSRLYTRKDGKLSISNNTRWRSNWFVGIDIPLANFWTKSFKK